MVSVRKRRPKARKSSGDRLFRTTFVRLYPSYHLGFLDWHNGSQLTVSCQGGVLVESVLFGNLLFHKYGIVPSKFFRASPDERL